MKRALVALVALGLVVFGAAAILEALRRLRVIGV
jgi:hypothetical protein